VPSNRKPSLHDPHVAAVVVQVKQFPAHSKIYSTVF